MLEIGLTSLLQASTAITSLVGQRIFPIAIPKSETPQNGPVPPTLVYKAIGSQSTPTFDTAGLQRKRIEFACWGTTYIQAITLREALIGVLQGYRGTLSDGTTVQTVLVITGTDDFLQDSLSYCATQEFYILFN
jgi:hypothetical protein